MRFEDLNEKQQHKVIQMLKADGYTEEAQLVAHGNLWDEIPEEYITEAIEIEGDI